MTGDLGAAKKRDDRLVEGWLLNAEDRLDEYRRARDAILEASPRVPEVTTSGWSPSNQTEDKGVQLASLAENEAWVQFVTSFTTGLALNASHLFVVLQLRREYRDRRGRAGWVGPCMARYPQELAKITGEPPAKHFKASRNTFHSMWREIVDLAVREALREGLIQ